MEQRPPLIDYLAKDYESFRQLMLDRLSATLPAWQERHATDLGITIVEVLAYVADHLSYYQDSVATEAYLGTARKRISIRRHARLLDYVLHEGCSARTWVHIQVTKGVEPLELDLSNIEFLTEGAGAAHPGERQIEYARDAGPAIFEPVLRGKVALRHDFNEMPVAGQLTKGATSLVVILPHTRQLSRGEVLILRVEKVHPETHKRVPTYHPVMLTEASRPEGTDVQRIHFHRDDAIPESMTVGGDAVALGNNVLVDHGGPWQIEKDLKAIAGRLPPLQKVGLAHGVPATSSPLGGASAMLEQDPRAALPCIVLQRDGAPWGVVRRDLLDTWPEQRYFCVEFDDDGRAHIRFGDGVGGEMPMDHATFDVHYRLGGGLAGNVSAGSIAGMRLKGGENESRVSSVSNPLPAIGGRERESGESARMLAPRDMRHHQRRAITALDYVEFARRVPGVKNAMVAVAQQGARRIVSVAIDPQGYTTRWTSPDNPAGAREKWEALSHRVVEVLDAVRRINHDVVIVEPTYVVLDICIAIDVLPGWIHADVVEHARALMDQKKEGSYFHVDNVTFGQTIYWSHVVALLHGIPGVAAVEPIRFARLDRRATMQPGKPPPSQIDIGAVEIPIAVLEIKPIGNAGVR